MAKTDQYDRMNTNQLEDEARSRGLDVAAFQQLANNAERAQQLRNHDAATQATTEQAQRNAQDAAQRQQNQQAQQAQQQDQQAQQEAQRQAQAQAGQGDQAQATDTVQVDRSDQQQTGRQPGQGDAGPFDTAPYPNDESRQAAIDAASGNLSTDQSIDTSQAPSVGGQAGETPAEQRQREQENQ